ncbi:MAG: hypothetical protein CMJ79_03115 [Planctomycetaceae bacterium]|nr:hypothetical protein [Planctomycetaceae bacterium]|tara:strand:- start:402 stop:593 length:192 start_codon:yes stop_codon:yes gene_type:complete
MSEQKPDQEFELPIYKSQDCESETVEPQVTLDMFNELQLEVMQLRAEFSKLRRQLEEQAETDH